MKFSLHLFCTCLFFNCALSQSELQVSYSNSGSTINSISINGNAVEYGLCSEDPTIYVAIIDTACEAWGTHFLTDNIEHEFGNFNTNGNCRSRVEYFFAYKQQVASDLVYLDSLLNFWIPENNTIVLWTTGSYNYNAINSICPQLGSTLINKWGPVVQSSSLIVLNGIQGLESTFQAYISQIENTINYNTSVCLNSSLGITETSFTKDKTVIKIFNALGQEAVIESNVLLFYLYSDGHIEKVFINE